MKRTICMVLMLSVFVCVVPASVNALSLGAASNYNSFIFGDFSCTSDTEGRLAVGGNAYLSGYSVGYKLNSSDLNANNDLLVVGGDLSFVNGTVYGDVLVGGEADMKGVQLAGGSLYEETILPFDFASEESYLKGLSTELAGEKTNGTVEDYYGSLKLTGDGSSVQQVFNIDGSDLLNAHGISISDIPEDATVVINVTGSSTGLTNMGLDSLLPIRNRVLFNFYEATDLTFSGVGIQGSVLAPFANISNPQGVIWGTVIAESWSGSMQQNHTPFTGDLIVTTTNSSDPVPEPGTIFLLGSGLVGLIGFMRRKQRR